VYKLVMGLFIGAILWIVSHIPVAWHAEKVCHEAGYLEGRTDAGYESVCVTLGPDGKRLVVPLNEVSRR
jgi:hypothetical protein